MRMAEIQLGLGRGSRRAGWRRCPCCLDLPRGVRSLAPGQCGERAAGRSARLSRRLAPAGAIRERCVCRHWNAPSKSCGRGPRTQSSGSALGARCGSHLSWRLERRSTATWYMRPEASKTEKEGCLWHKQCIGRRRRECHGRLPLAILIGVANRRREGENQCTLILG
jgi:hypothetical protein